MIEVHTATDEEIEEGYKDLAGRSAFIDVEHELYDFVEQHKINLNYAPDRGGMWYVDYPGGRVFRKHLRYALMAAYVAMEQIPWDAPKPTKKRTRKRRRR